jgi:hypothetical protein
VRVKNWRILTGTNTRFAHLGALERKNRTACGRGLYNYRLSMDGDVTCRSCMRTLAFQAAVAQGAIRNELPGTAGDREPGGPAAPVPGGKG